MGNMSARQRGNLSEARFKQLCALQSWPCFKSSDEDDMFKHIDFYVVTDDGEIAVDVKSSSDVEQIWIELKNVRGDKGWLYGEATHICFDVPLVNKMVMVEREELAAYIAENCQKVFVKKDEAYLKLYTRQGRADIITFIKLYDLFYLSTFQIYRHES
jgi:hypothetical protein